jgi:hypothetical protein
MRRGSEPHPEECVPALTIEATATPLAAGPDPTPLHCRCQRLPASVDLAHDDKHNGHDSEEDGNDQDELGRHWLHRVVYIEDRSRQLSSSPREAAGYDVPPPRSMQSTCH